MRPFPTRHVSLSPLVGRAHCLGLEGRRRDGAGPPNRHPRMYHISKFFRTCVDQVDADVASLPMCCRTETTRRWVASALSPCGREDVLTPEIEKRTTHGRVDGDRWTDSTDGQGMGYARLGERILAALEIHHAALFERHDYAAATRNRTPRIPGPPRPTRVSLSSGPRDRRRMSVAMPSFLLLPCSLFRHGSPMHHPLKRRGLFFSNKEGRPSDFT